VGGQPLVTQQSLRIIYPTQSTGIRLFWRLHSALNKQGRSGRTGFFATNRYETNMFLKENSDFPGTNANLITEWDLLKQAAGIEEVDNDLIAYWESRIGDPTLWNALIVDRRLVQPLAAQYKQDYRSAYSHEFLLRLLQVSLVAINEQFETIQPHAVISLNAVTVYDYIYYLMAKYRGIPCLQLKLTRVENYISFHTDPFILSPHIAEVYRRMQDQKSILEEDRKAITEARDFIFRTRQKTLDYEGAINKPGEKLASLPADRKESRSYHDCSGTLQEPRMKFPRLTRVVQGFCAKDPHYPTTLRSILNARIVRPLRRFWHFYRFDVHDAGEFAAMNCGNYAVYPMNTEPEVALLAFGRTYRNQIETVRNIATSLPVGMKLVVKEHPNSYGYRKRSYYRKLSEIPNVLLASPKANTGQLVDNCAMVALVYGTIGLEAIIKRKPVLVLARAPYSDFPATMVRYVDGFPSMSKVIRSLLKNYHHDESCLEAFIGAHIRTSIRINLFTQLLGKSGRKQGEFGRSLNEQYDRLAAYAKSRIAEEQQRLLNSGEEEK